MALSGTLNTNAYQGRYVQFSWTATQDIAKNQSTIKWTLKGAGTGSSGWYEAAPFYVSIAGTKVYESSNRIQLWNGTQVASGTTVINHDTDGSKDFTVNVKAAIYYYDYNCTGTDTFTLDDIPRAATITKAIDFNDEEKPSVNYSNAAGSAASVQIGLFWDSAGSSSLIPFTTVTGISGTKTFTLTTAQQQAIWNKLANAKNTDIYYLIKTKIGTYEKVNSVKKVVSITNASPTLAPTAVDSNEKCVAATGDALRWIKGYADVAYTFGAAAKKGATIKKYKVECGSKSATTATGTLQNVDSGTIRFIVTDSRGFIAVSVLNRTFINYTDLTCNLAVSAILNSSTTARATIKADGRCFIGELKAGKANSLSLEYRYKAESGDYGEWRAITPTKSNNQYSISYEVPYDLDYRLAYTFQVRARDDLYIAYGTYKTSTEKTVKALPVFDWSNNDFNFNVPVTFSGGVSDGADTFNLMGLIKAMSARYELPCTITKGDNYTSVDVSLFLYGNVIRGYMTAKRSSVSGAGNIANENVCNVKFNTGGKVTGYGSVAFSSGSAGGLATFQMMDTALNGNEAEFNISLCATGTAGDEWNSYFVIPCTIDINKY
jgi:hypothetical protein